MYRMFSQLLTAIYNRELKSLFEALNSELKIYVDQIRDGDC